jgi:mRNA-degrading endonuclease RelE of RelBE toxin-antitoxin system
MSFRPTIGELIDALEADPKQFPKKHGKPKGCRAAPVVYADGIVWRAVYELNERKRTVRVLALGPHDEAYEDAGNRS